MLEGRLDRLESFCQIVFGAPLYRKLFFDREKDSAGLRKILGHPHKADGYCVYCRSDSVFAGEAPIFPNSPFDSVDLNMFLASEVGIYYRDRAFWIRCARCEGRYRYVIDLMSDHLVKIGQYPNPAEIEAARFDRYRHVDLAARREMRAAIALAEQGIGIGSYVYMRRVLEHILDRRFEAHRNEEGWDEAAYRRMRVDEKIALLRDFLPEPLVDHQSVYADLDRDIRSVSEGECLALFEAWRDSVVMILEEDEQGWLVSAGRARAEASVARYLSTRLGPW